jgi:hypothetical protein
MNSQNKLLLQYMKNGNDITPLKALKMFGCMRLASRIYDLKSAGWNIKSDFVLTSTGKRVKQFWL